MSETKLEIGKRYYFDVTKKFWGILDHFDVDGDPAFKAETPTFPYLEVLGFIGFGKTNKSISLHETQPEIKPVETLLSEQHLNTRHDTVEIVNAHFVKMGQTSVGSNPLFDKFWSDLTRDIMNMPQRKP